jgi:hypothetical protein
MTHRGVVWALARDLLKLHARACDSGVADPVKLAQWMIRFRFIDQDFFEPDPGRYRDALGEKGLGVYRAAVEERSNEDVFAVRYARGRLAIFDRDTERIVALLGRDLSAAHQFLAVAEAMLELDLPEEALGCATRGTAQTRDWHTDCLYDLAREIQASAGRPVEALALRRAQHERSPTAGSYSQLQRAADLFDACRRPTAERMPAPPASCSAQAQRRPPPAKPTSSPKRSPRSARSIVDARQ